MCYLVLQFSGSVRGRRRKKESDRRGHVCCCHLPFSINLHCPLLVTCLAIIVIISALIICDIATMVGICSFLVMLYSLDNKVIFHSENLLKVYNLFMETQLWTELLLLSPKLTFDVL